MNIQDGYFVEDSKYEYSRFIIFVEGSIYKFSRSVGLVPLMGLKETGLAWSGTVKEEGNMMAHTRAPHTFNQ